MVGARLSLNEIVHVDSHLLDPGLDKMFCLSVYLIILLKIIKDLRLTLFIANASQILPNLLCIFLLIESLGQELKLHNLLVNKLSNSPNFTAYVILFVNKKVLFEKNRGFDFSLRQLLQKVLLDFLIIAKILLDIDEILYGQLNFLQLKQIILDLGNLIDVNIKIIVLFVVLILNLIVFVNFISIAYLY